MRLRNKFLLLPQRQESIKIKFISDFLLFFMVFVLVVGPLVFVTSAKADKQVLLIENPWLREAPPGAMSLAAYMNITNITDSVVSIQGVSSEIAKMTELHEMKMENDMMQMRELPEIVLQPGQTIELKPKGHHVMFMGVEQSFKEGDEVEIEFKLSNHPPVNVILPVKKAS